MTLFILAYLGGALTILAPCILPVIPFVFARADRPFARSGLPLLAGMALTFAAVGTLGAVAGQWAVTLNDYGRMAALLALALTGVALLAPHWAQRLGRPLVALGARLSDTAGARSGDEHPSPMASVLLGVATGLLWAPCAGPILGLILTGAALQGPSAQTSLLLLAYGAGAMTSLALALVLGGRLLGAMKRTFRIGDWLRRGLGAAVLAGVAAIALGVDTGWLAQLPAAAGGTTLEKHLLDRLMPAPVPPAGRIASADIVAPTLQAPNPFVHTQLRSAPARAPLPDLGAMPPIEGAVQWLNSPPLTAEGLRGKVVLIDFWTFGCINCRNALPHVREWERKYRDQGLVVIGVHTPEFAYEKNIGNVKRALGDLGIEFPVAVDNDFKIWRAFGNMYWPSHYFVDAGGRIRFHHDGEGAYEQSEQVIRQLLDEARAGSKPV